MSDGKILSIIIAAAVVALASAFFYLAHPRNPAASPHEATNSPLLASPASTAPTTAISATFQAPAAALRPPGPSELDTLRAALKAETEKNQRLEQTIAGMKASAGVNPPTVDISIEEVQEFAKLLVSKIGDHDQAYWNDAAAKENKDSRASGNWSGDTSYSISTILVSTDLKRTDSVVNPLMGEVVFSQANFMSTKPSFCGSDRQETIVLRVAKHAGKWSIVSASSKVDRDNFWPEVVNHHSREGQTEVLRPSIYSDECDAINGGK